MNWRAEILPSDSTIIPIRVFSFECVRKFGLRSGASRENRGLAGEDDGAVRQRSQGGGKLCEMLRREAGGAEAGGVAVGLRGVHPALQGGGGKHLRAP